MVVVRPRWFWLLCALLASPAAGCGDSSFGGGGASGAGSGGGGSGGSTPDAGPDGMVNPASCSAGGASHAVVIAISGDAPEVRVLGQNGGTLHDGNLHLTVTDIPNAIAMRGDGGEAVVAWGGFGRPYGVPAVEVAPDGSSATLGERVQLGTDLTPSSVTYVSQNRILVTASGSSSYTVITLDRKGTSFAETTRVAAPGAFPLQVIRRPGTDEALLTRWDSLSEDHSTVYLLAPMSSGAYTKQGTAVTVNPPALYIATSPSGNVVYTPTGNPSDPVTPTHLDGTGMLFVLGVSEGGISSLKPLTLPRVSDFVTRDPAGQFLVLSGANYELDPATGTPIVRTYTLLTSPLAADGSPQATLPESPLFQALMPDDLAVSTTGHLIMAYEMYPNEVPPAMEYPLEIRAQTSPGQWQVCQTLYMPGQSHLVIAP
jgi:hypothetical protein